MKILLSLMMLLLFGYAVSAQDGGAPKVTYEAGRVVEMSNLIGEDAAKWGCIPSGQYSGTVTNRLYTQKMISGFTLRQALGESAKFMINQPQINLLGAKGAGLLASLLSTRRKLHIRMFHCNPGTGAADYAYVITQL